MIDLILAACSAGLLAFLAFFLVSFLVLFVFMAIIHISGLLLHHLFQVKAFLFRESTV